jgi:homoserine O-succinyltransferase/O-acetyltransferase
MPTVDVQSSAVNLRGRDQLVIGIVNNMPDGALHTTERQFHELLFAAAKNFELCLRFFSLPGLPRGHEAQSYVSRCYEDIGKLWSSRLDGLIVTGTEPRASTLTDEPYWSAIKQLVDQAEEHATSTVWSCLAAHAAVLHLDGVQRRLLCEKLSGVFECTKMSPHELVANVPSRWYVPHSRYNDLPEQELLAKGYQILSGSPVVGADIFIRKGRALFVFVQGHLEYDSGALLREYRRDIRRYLAGERDNYPPMPRDYFDFDTQAALLTFRGRAMIDRNADLLLHFPPGSGNLAHSWHEPAVSFYGSWLSHLVRRDDRAAAFQCAGSLGQW